MPEAHEGGAVLRPERVREGFRGRVTQGDGFDCRRDHPEVGGEGSFDVEVAECEGGEFGAGEQGLPEVDGTWMETEFDGGEMNVAGSEGEDNLCDGGPEELLSGGV